ncbi:hypothetical protein [Microvirga sp. TS319]
MPGNPDTRRDPIAGGDPARKAAQRGDVSKGSQGPAPSAEKQNSNSSATP